MGRTQETESPVDLPVDESGSRPVRGSRTLHELASTLVTEDAALEAALAARVAILSEDPRLVARVRVGLGHGVDVVRYGSLEELCQSRRAHASVVLDCRACGGPAGLVARARNARSVLERADVLLLFAGVGERSALRSACPLAGVIVCSTRDVDDAELADLLATFVGTR